MCNTKHVRTRPYPKNKTVCKGITKKLMITYMYTFFLLFSRYTFPLNPTLHYCVNNGFNFSDSIKKNFVKVDLIFFRLHMVFKE